MTSEPVVHSEKPAPAAASSRLIGGQYLVDLGRPLAGAAGGLPSFGVNDPHWRKLPLMAIETHPAAPPRARLFGVLEAAPIPGLLLPLAHGAAPGADGLEASFVICQAPPGSSLAAAPHTWGEGELLERLLRPAASVLEALQQRGATHRAIRPDNLFRAAAADPVVLGVAWAAPPASLQPAQFEPPYSAMCLRGGRGEGGIADDVYALGVTMLTLALGRLPLAGLDDNAIIRRKLDLGSFAALVEEARLPPAIGDLLRSMLAEDPAHRPPPALLMDPPAARARRVAARPVRRAQRPVPIAELQAWDARSLANAIALHPEEGVRLLRNGTLDNWLRRGLGDGNLVARLDEAMSDHDEEPGGSGTASDALVAMRLVMVLDPLAPLCWRGIALWPDGLGPALAAARAGDADVAQRLEDMILAEAAGDWAAMRGERADSITLRQEARQQRTWLRIRGTGGGLARVAYALNPLLPCTSPLLAGRSVARLADLLPALEAASTNTEQRRFAPIDPEIAAFIAARQDHRLGGDPADFAGDGGPGGAALAQLRALSRLQTRTHTRKLPGLAAWLAEQVTPSIETWHHRPRRAQIERQLGTLAAAGQLAPMLALLDDPTARGTDRSGLEQAAAVVQAIDLELAAITANTATRAEAALRIGHEIAAGAGLATLAIVLISTALG